MPKIRDLGINGIPETMRPPEVGAGGGGGDGDCQGATHENCPAGTLIQTVGAGCYGKPPCTAGTLEQTEGGGCYGEERPCPAGTLNQSDATCYGDPAPCTAGTLNQSDATCYDDPAPCPAGTLNQSDATCYDAPCTAGTLQQTEGGGCYGKCAAGTLNQSAGGGCYGDAPQCGDTLNTTSPQIVHMTAEQTGQAAAAGLTREAVALLKQQLKEHTAQLDEIAKSAGPKTADEIDAREQQLKAELEELANLRNSLKTEE